MKITFISDTHTKHHQITSQLPGGDLLVHSGDFSSRGYEHEVDSFFDWFNGLDNYTNKIVIAGNHDLMFEDDPRTLSVIIQRLLIFRMIWRLSVMTIHLRLNYGVLLGNLSFTIGHSTYHEVVKNSKINGI